METSTTYELLFDELRKVPEEKVKGVWELVATIAAELDPNMTEEIRALHEAIREADISPAPVFTMS